MDCSGLGRLADVHFDGCAVTKLLVCLGLSIRLAAAQSFDDPLEVTLVGQYSVTRVSSGTSFSPITLSAVTQSHVPLNWQSPPAFQIICTNDNGWSATLKGPSSGSLSGPTGSSLGIDYEFGSGTITTHPTSDPVNPRDAELSGDLRSGVKTVSVPQATRGSYRDLLGNFYVPTLPPTQLAGVYGGPGLLVTTFANTP